MEAENRGFKVSGTKGIGETTFDRTREKMLEPMLSIEDQTSISLSEAKRIINKSLEEFRREIDSRFREISYKVNNNSASIESMIKSISILGEKVADIEESIAALRPLSIMRLVGLWKKDTCIHVGEDGFCSVWSVSTAASREIRAAKNVENVLKEASGRYQVNVEAIPELCIGCPFYKSKGKQVY